MYSLAHATRLQIARLTLSTKAADDVSQYKLHMLLHCVVLHKFNICNFDSFKSFTCYIMSFGYFPWDFPASRGLICCCTMLYYMLSAATVNDNEI